MSESSKRILTRREALRLSATAGMGMVAGARAYRSCRRNESLDIYDIGLQEQANHALCIVDLGP